MASQPKRFKQGSEEEEDVYGTVVFSDCHIVVNGNVSIVVNIDAAGAEEQEGDTGDDTPTSDGGEQAQGESAEAEAEEPGDSPICFQAFVPPPPPPPGPVALCCVDAAQGEEEGDANPTDGADEDGEGGIDVGRRLPDGCETDGGLSFEAGLMVKAHIQRSVDQQDSVRQPSTSTQAAPAASETDGPVHPDTGEAVAPAAPAAPAAEPEPTPAPVPIPAPPPPAAAALTPTAAPVSPQPAAEGSAPAPAAPAV
ncbi:ORF11R [Marbled eel polyomavirus]|nr:ORF11R [Marbled eel polyomavirus]ANC70202.1 ORF11R [Marbled eel polyomavirus]